MVRLDRYDRAAPFILVKYRSAESQRQNTAKEKYRKYVRLVRWLCPGFGARVCDRIPVVAVLVGVVRWLC